AHVHHVPHEPRAVDARPAKVERDADLSTVHRLDGGDVLHGHAGLLPFRGWRTMGRSSSCPGGPPTSFNPAGMGVASLYARPPHHASLPAFRAVAAWLPSASTMPSSCGSTPNRAIGSPLVVVASSYGVMGR